MKHIVARSTKQFFGYGPAERVDVVIHEDLVIFATRFSGPGILDTLPTTPFGRLAMRHIADLFANEVTADLIRVANEQFGVGLRTIYGDLDYETGYSLGLALLDQPLTPPAEPLDPGPLTHLVGGRGITLSTGPHALVLRAATLPLPEGPGAEGEFAALTAREALRTELRAALMGEITSEGPFFMVNGPEGLLAGALL